MKKLLFMLLMLASGLSAQTRIGQSYHEIYNDMEGKERKVTYEEGTLILVVFQEGFTTGYTFDKDEKCYSFTVFPDNESIAKEFVEIHNNDYGYSYDGTWETTICGRKYRCVKGYVSGVGTFFTWVEVE